MMLVVIIGGFSGIWAIAFLSLPIFLSIMMGLTIQFGKDKPEATFVTLETKGEESMSKVG